jgi:hypothetical protein
MVSIVPIYPFLNKCVVARLSFLSLLLCSAYSQADRSFILAVFVKKVPDVRGCRSFRSGSAWLRIFSGRNCLQNGTTIHTSSLTGGGVGGWGVNILNCLDITKRKWKIREIYRIWESYYS